MQRAWEVLGDARRRKAYDSARRVKLQLSRKDCVVRSTRVVDCVVDLDDMACTYDEAAAVYAFTKRCRCGEMLRVTEDELAANHEAGGGGEFRLECSTCSLVTIIGYREDDTDVHADNANGDTNVEAPNLDDGSNKLPSVSSHHTHNSSNVPPR